MLINWGNSISEPVPGPLCNRLLQVGILSVFIVVFIYLIFGSVKLMWCTQCSQVLGNDSNSATKCQVQKKLHEPTCLRPIIAPCQFFRMSAKAAYICMHIHQHSGNFVPQN